ncbi:hypothetical protein [Nocardioides sp. YIM 152588]|uniref:hypothetical protein n=1 Tax=Nocardioides sp. YIM 152588 TaxID=3158259 RepID=UPI0032E3C3B8
MLRLADFEKPFYGLSPRGSAGKPLTVTVIVVAMNLRKWPEPVLTATDLETVIFGPGGSVAEWIEEMSQGRLLLVPHPTVPVLGPRWSSYDYRFYYREGPWSPGALAEDSPHRWVDAGGVYGEKGRVWYLDDDGYVGGHSHSWGEMLRAVDADPRISLSSYDTDKDGSLAPTECLFLLVKNQAATRGFRRPVFASEVPLPAKKLGLDGVHIANIAELYAAPPHGWVDVAAAGEELLHLAADLDDQYPDTGRPQPPPPYRTDDDPGRPGQYSISDAGGRPVHVDPYHKLKWGWLNPQLADATGTYTLGPAATTGDALILANPHVGTREFFIVENRWRGASYDQHRDKACGDGLAVWHCIQDPSLADNWARRAVHLRRADPRLGATGLPQDERVLFDGSAPGRGYDLHDDSTPTNLRFRDGSPSRLAIRAIPPAAETMTIHVTVPPEPGSVAVAVGRVSRLRVHERGTGYGVPGRRLPQDCVVSVDSEPGGTFGIDLGGPEGRWMFDLVSEAFARGEPVRLEYRAQTADGGEVLRVLRA